MRRSDYSRCVLSALGPTLSVLMPYPSSPDADSGGESTKLRASTGGYVRTYPSHVCVMAGKELTVQSREI